MPDTDRRNMIRVGLAFVALPSTILHLGCKPAQDDRAQSDKESKTSESETETGRSSDSQLAANEAMNEVNSTGNSMQIQYLEIVTPEVDAVCQTYSTLHGVTFKEADPSLGGARTGKLIGGGMIGVRAPMRETENPVVRPYVLVDDIQAAIDAAAEAGAEVAIPPMEIPGHGKFAIFIQGGIESGLWQH